MEKISKDEALRFIRSNLNELEYFGLDKDGLISLKDYIEEIKEKKEKYERLIKKPLDSIKEKNRWVTNVVPNYDRANVLSIYGKSEPTLGTIYLLKNDNYEFVLRDEMVVVPFMNLKVRNRKKVLDNSQSELKEILDISTEMKFEHENYASASELFNVDSFGYYNSCWILQNNSLLYDSLKSEDNIYIPKYEHLVGIEPLTGQIYIPGVGLLEKNNNQEAQNLIRKLYIKK